MKARRWDVFPFLLLGICLAAVALDIATAQQKHVGYGIVIGKVVKGTTTLYHSDGNKTIVTGGRMLVIQEKDGVSVIAVSERRWHEYTVGDSCPLLQYKGMLFQHPKTVGGPVQ